MKGKEDTGVYGLEQPAMACLPLLLTRFDLLPWRVLGRPNEHPDVTLNKPASGCWDGQTSTGCWLAVSQTNNIGQLSHLRQKRFSTKYVCYKCHTICSQITSHCRCVYGRSPNNCSQESFTTYAVLARKTLPEIITPDRSNFSRENCYRGHRTDGMMSRIAYAWRFLFSWLYYYKYHTQVVPMHLPTKPGHYTETRHQHYRKCQMTPWLPDEW
jgi:hypothetical protein